MRTSSKLSQAKLAVENAVENAAFTRGYFDIVVQTRGHLILVSGSRLGLEQPDFTFELSAVTGQIYKAYRPWVGAVEDWSNDYYKIDLREAANTDSETTLRMGDLIANAINEHIIAMTQTRGG
jgi:hypothetical protein